MKKILCIGQSTHDTTYVLDYYPKENTKIKATDFYTMGGGSVGNAAYLLRKYKEEVSIISTFGTDSKGQQILQEYNRIGLKLHNCLVKDGFTTPVNSIMINKATGSRTIMGYRKKNEIPDDYKILYDMQPEIVYMDGYESEIALKAAQLFPNAIFVLDAGSLKQEFIDLARITHYFICSEDFAKAFCKIEKIDETNFDEIFSKLETINSKTIVVTLGERGSLYKIDGKIKVMPTYKTKVVDTTGAGDIYHGAFVYALSNNYSFEDALRFSSACAAISVTRKGGQTSIPELQEVLDLMKTGK